MEATYVERNGLYDQLIIGHSFKKDLQRKKLSTDNAKIENFQPILSTNGICYAFNGDTLPSIWKPSKVTTTFDEMFPSEHVEKYFGGVGSMEGK